MSRKRNFRINFGIKGVKKEVLNLLLRLYFFLFFEWLVILNTHTLYFFVVGTFSIICIIFLTKHMDFLDEEITPLHKNFIKTCLYFIFIIKEIIKANIAVAKIVLGKNPNRIRQQMLFVPLGEIGRSPSADVVFSNSITITPGTITIVEHVENIEIESSQDDEEESGQNKNNKNSGSMVFVHALAPEFADVNALEIMRQKVKESFAL